MVVGVVRVERHSQETHFSAAVGEENVVHKNAAGGDGGIVVKDADHAFLFKHVEPAGVMWRLERAKRMRERQRWEHAVHGNAAARGGPGWRHTRGVGRS